MGASLDGTEGQRARLGKNLGMGLRTFSMHPSQILEVKSRVLKADVSELAPQVRRILRLEETGKIREAVDKLNNPAPVSDA